MDSMNNSCGLKVLAPFIAALQMWAQVAPSSIFNISSRTS